MGIWETVRGTFFDPVFYRRIIATSPSDSLKLFAVLGAVGIGLSMLIASVGIIPFAFSDFLGKLQSAYPDELIITVANGELSINKPEPYYIKNTIDSGDLKNLVIFDTGDTLSGDAQANSTLILVKKKYVIAGSANQARAGAFDSIQSTSTVRKADVISLIDTVRPYFKIGILVFAAFMFVVFTLIGTMFWVLVHFIYVLFPATLVFFYLMARKPRMTYSRAYMLTLYSTVPVAILSYACGLASVSFPGFVYTLLVLLVSVIVTSKLSGTAEQEQTQV